MFISTATFEGSCSCSLLWPRLWLKPPALAFASASAASLAPAPAAFAVAPAFASALALTPSRSCFCFALASAPAFALAPALALTPALGFSRALALTVFQGYLEPRNLPPHSEKVLKGRDDFGRSCPNVFLLLGGCLVSLIKGGSD